MTKDLLVLGFFCSLCFVDCFRKMAMLVHGFPTKLAALQVPTHTCVQR